MVPDFTETVRRYVIKSTGEEKLYNEGLKVFTTCKIDFQRKAVEAVEKGVAEVEYARIKNAAILQTVPKEEIPELLQKRSTPDLQENKQEDKVYQGVVVKVTPRKQEGFWTWPSARNW